MPKIGRAILLSFSLLAVTAASASAATWAPAGHGFKAASGSITLQEPSPFGGAPGPVVCSSSSTSGTLANPGSSVATTSPWTFTPSACAMPAFEGAYSAKVTPVSKVWLLDAVTTSSARLRTSPGYGLAIEVLRANGTLVCTQFVETTNGMNGVWSNAARTLTFTEAPLPYSNLSSCAEVGIPSTPASRIKVSGTLTFANTTNPAQPIQILP